MALRLRRGTNTERQTATFSEGELIYVTDYESAGVSPLWIGDGSTVGGNEVETGGTPSLALNDLTDVNAAAIENNILVYQGSQWTSVDPTTLGISGSGIVEGQEYNISINGSVIAGDSSVIVDSVTQVVTANLFVGSGAGLTDINLVDLEDVFAFGAQQNDVLTYDGTGWVPLKPASLLEGIEYNINIQGDVIGLDSSILLDAATNTLNGTVVGNVIGNVDGHLTGSVFSDNSTLIIDGITGIVYTDFIKGQFPLTIDNGTGLHIVDTSDYSALHIIRKDPLIDISPISPVTAYGTIRFERDDINGLALSVYIQGGSDGFKVFNLADGLTFDTTKSMHFDMSGNLIIGGATATEKLDVRGNGIFSGDVQAAAFKGSVVGDDSTVLVDAVNNVIPGYISIATLQSIVASSATYGDFQTAIAAL